jgi:hypothetical protein
LTVTWEIAVWRGNVNVQNVPYPIGQTCLAHAQSSETDLGRQAQARPTIFQARFSEPTKFLLFAKGQE